MVRQAILTLNRDFTWELMDHLKSRADLVRARLNIDDDANALQALRDLLELVPEIRKAGVDLKSAVETASPK
ncbi:hypothetical protein [Methylocella silvestris]|uniref:Uncharacterized protein n=1 Tax=Methylocella silvestris TaxID=199596 RepID=A0A2J7TMB0_METSI|nr:hypothetical protein [Methylocella silvestris]PNG27894.1 hypothetical protein CR492_03120 [Methylocella silvestris]